MLIVLLINKVIMTSEMTHNPMPNELSEMSSVVPFLTAGKTSLLPTVELFRL